MSVVAEPKILILDDDAAHGDSVRALLASQHYSAEATTDAAGAMQRLQRGEFQVLILDINMPRISGIDVLEYLADHEVTVKTIVLSGESSVHTITPILRLGAYDYLPKPYEPQQLLTSVANALERCRLEMENRSMAARVEAEHALHELLVNSSPDLIYVLDEHGRFTFANRPLNEVIAHAPKEVTGRPWQEVLGEELASALRHHFDERRTGERATRHFEFDYRPAADELRVLEFSATGLYEGRDDTRTGRFVGTYGVLRDVTEVRRTARELAQSRLKFYGLFMDSPDASYIARLDDGRLLEANRSFRRIQALLGAEGHDSDAFLYPDAATREAFVHRVALGSEPKTVALDRQSASGMRHLELTGKTLILDDQLCLLATVHDRTHVRQAEMDRLNLQNRLQQANKMEAIGQLAGGIAHDFNNILASMIGYAELVQGSRARFSPEQTDSYLNEVISAGNRARDLISQMLTFTRAHRGDPRPVDVAAAINDVSRMLRAAIPAHIDIHTEIDADLAAVNADPVQLQQIIINLLVNARDAINGPGLIRVALRRGRQHEPCAACGERLGGAHVVLSVTDSGHGISEAIRDRMFDMYFTTREPGKGTGIGLWLINNLIHEYRGHVTVSSDVGRGTTFEVHLPVADAVPDAAVDPVETEPARAAGGLVLVVDDEVSVGNFMGEVLRDAGYEVRVFNESPSALRYLQAHADQVAVLITDQNMPLMNGKELAEQAKARVPDLPVALITGFATGQQAQQWKRLGLDAFLAKPFRIRELLDTVAALMSARESESRQPLGAASGPR